MIPVREPPLAPVRAAERMDALDAVRGAAVLGILLANVVAMSGFPFLPPDHYRSLPLADWHPAAYFLVLFLIEAKFYSYAAFGPVEWLWRMFTYRRTVPLFR